MTPLDAGVTLLEASAGTGKTFHIAHTVLRLVAEEGLPIERIVVVTFTEAATSELRDRVRRRLRDALDGVDAGDEGWVWPDALLEAWVRAAPPSAGPRLRRALVDFDEASISTIHGFCQRVLTHHAFESGASFGAQIAGDSGEMLAELVDDFWANLVYDADPALLPALQTARIDRDGLADLARKVADPLRPVIPPPTPLVVPDLAAWTAVCAAVSDAWHPTAVAERILHHPGIVKVGRGGAVSYPDKRTRDFAYDVQKKLKGLDPAAPLPEALAYFLPERLAAGSPKGPPPVHPALEALARLADVHEAGRDAVRRFVVAVRHALVDRVRAELPARYAAEDVHTFDSLLLAVRDALVDPVRGPALRAAVRARHDVALIDEFQDTDPVQWTIFDALFRDRMCVIGDPKQAIYAFRGADVFTYHRAARTAGVPKRLGTSYRSDAPLVRAINHLFARPDLTTPFGVDGPSYQPMTAHHERRLEGDDGAALQIRFLSQEKRQSKWGLEDAIPAVVAADVARTLGTGLHIEGRPLSPRDCAVLVRTHAQAAAVQASLRERGLPSVLRSDKPVLNSPERAELVLVLAAVDAPTNASAVRAALVTRLMGRTADDLVRLETDDAGWAEIAASFRRWRALWEARGFHAMFRAWLDDDAVIERLLRQAGGERRVADLLHLGELLHDASVRRRLGPVGLIAWVQQGAPGLDPKAAELRLESDADAVRVLTIHAAKGLEFPLVWCPFLWGDAFLSKIDVTNLVFHDDEGHIQVDVGSPAHAAHEAKRRQEGFEEDLRIIYVAVTRAMHRCTLYWTRAAGEPTLAWLLHQRGGQSPRAAFGRPYREGDMLEDLHRLAEHPDIAVSVIDPDDDARWEPPDADLTDLAVRPFTRSLDRLWRRSSFTGMVRGATHDDATVDHDGGTAADVPDADEAVPLHDMPGGARVGEMVHRILELHDFTDPGALAGLVADHAGRFGLDAAWNDRLTDALQGALTTPLEVGGVRLCDVPRSRRLDELAFTFPLRGGFDAHAEALTVDALARAFADGPLGPSVPSDWPDRVRRLAFAPVRGFLTGSIDLAYEHGGRWYVVDYKTNQLGPSFAHYRASGLGAHMATARYVLQYHLYVVALHRYLRHRVPGYRYDQHFGGAQYLFLRGMTPERGPGFGVFRDRPPEALVHRLDAVLSGVAP